jgi:hypothetical protein
MRITEVASGRSWVVDTGGFIPAVSPDGERLLWEIVHGEVTPGQAFPGLELMISNLDGSERRRVYTQAGGWSVWLDDHRLLIVKPVQPTRAARQLWVLDVDNEQPEPYLLGEYKFLRGLQVAPGGRWIAFYLPFQDDPDDSGVYVQMTRRGAPPARKLDFFGAYQWRDDRSLYTLSFDITQDAHTLGYVDVDGSHRWLTNADILPIRVANGEWSVSPDGNRILYVDPTDYGLYLLTVEPAR